MQGLGKWPESIKTVDTSMLKEAKKIVLGVDVGTTSTQAVIMTDNSVAGYASIYSGYDFRASAEKAVLKAIGGSGLKKCDFDAIGATGFGRRNAAAATSFLNEITCHGIAARYMFGPTVTTVLDLGGQRTKAIRLYKWDRLMDFKINDKCASGFGRHIEVMCDILGVPLAEFGPKSLEAEEDPEPVSTTCYNFACSETIGLFRPGYKEQEYSGNDALAAFMFTIVWRILGTVGKLQPLDNGEIGVYEDFAITGGLAKNIGITKRLERELNAASLTSEYDPQLAGAIGAALLA